MNTAYQDAKAVSSNMGEYRDCAVVATSIVTRFDYREAHNTLKKFGRKDRDGTPMTITRCSIEHLGYKVSEPMDIRQPNGSHYTAKTIGKRLKRGYYLCRTSGHIFAVVNGQVCDWTEGGRHRILQVFKITKYPKIKEIVCTR